MKNNLEEFNKEIVNNFSELFVNTYIIRYLSDYNKDDLLKNTKHVYELLTKRLKIELRKQLQMIGYNKNDLNNL